MAYDYYAVLGIERNAAKGEIKKAYRFLAAQLHPDKHRGQNVKIAERKLKEINEAYEVLSDDAKRDAYDSSAAGGQSENTGGSDSCQKRTDNEYDEPESYNDYLVDQEMLREYNSRQSTAPKKLIIAFIVSIVAGVFFTNIARGCPARKEPDRSPLPSVEYVLPKSDGGSIIVESDILTKYFGISYEQRQISNLFMKDSYEYRYNGNGTWTITKKSAVNNTDKNYINTNNKNEVENYLHGLGF
jgi:hypothetical protein